MLVLAEAWAADSEGANIWVDSSVRFLDPFTKSGVFLREVTSRLTEGLADEIPNLEKRVDQVTLAGQVARVDVALPADPPPCPARELPRRRF